MPRAISSIGTAPVARSITRTLRQHRKYYSDKDGINEIKKADTVTAKLPGDPKSPRTGKASDLALWISLLLVSGGVTGVTAGLRKKKKHKV